MWDVLFFALFLSLLLLPLIPSLRELELKNDATPLSINQSHDGDIKIFSENFRQLVNQELEKNSRKLTSMASDKFRLIDGAFAISAAEQKERSVNQAIVSLKPLNLPNDYVFEREVYGKQNVISGFNDHFRAVLADEDLILKANTVVTRWAHGQRVRLGSNVTILGRVSADEVIVMKPSCAFTRINAPVIQFGLEKAHLSAEADPTNDEKVVARAFSDVDKAQMDESGGCWLVTGDFAIPPYGNIKSNMVVHGDLSIGKGAVVTGSVKTHGNLTLDSCAKVMGALVSENDVTIGEGCLVKGPVVSEKTVHIESGAVIGTMNYPTTVTADYIRAKSGACAHGTMWARSAAKLPNTR